MLVLDVNTLSMTFKKYLIFLPPPPPVNSEKNGKIIEVVCRRETTDHKYLKTKILCI